MERQGRKAAGSPRELPAGGGSIHEHVGLLEHVPAVTPATAVELLSRVFRCEFGFSSLGTFRSKPIDAESLWSRFNAPHEYERKKPRGMSPSQWENEDRTGVYSYPSNIRLLMLERPQFGWAYGNQNSLSFSWVFGLARTSHDPQTGRLEEKTWSREVAESYLRPPADARKSLNARRYPTWRPLWPDGCADEATCWARCDLVFPKGGRAYMGVSELQNTVLDAGYDDQVKAEYRRLFDNSTGKWRDHYRRVLKHYGEGRKAHENPPFTFTYPHRAMLLLLAGMRTAELLGVETFALAGRERRGDEISEKRVRDYHDFAAEFIENCRTGVRTVYVAYLEPGAVDKELKKHGRSLYG